MPRDLDHRKMSPPHLRVVSDYPTKGGDHVYRWDLRITAPNNPEYDYVPWDTLHSVEHFLGAGLLDRTDLGEGRAVAQVGPMGCGTGLYLVSVGIGDVDEMGDLIAGVLATVADADAVPLADVIHCGRASLHNLDGAQFIASFLLDARADWADLGPDAREISDGDGE